MNTEIYEMNDAEADAVVDKALQELDDGEEFLYGVTELGFDEYYDLLFDEPRERSWDDDYPTSPWSLADQIDWESIDYE